MRKCYWERARGAHGNLSGDWNFLFLSVSVRYIIIIVIMETLNICFIPVYVGVTHLIIENGTLRE